MSLFTVREWWAKTTEAEEEFGPGCLCVANLDNHPEGALKVATGSYSGVLRLFSPVDRDYRVEDLMLEMNLEKPILQLAVGQFLSESTRLALAVLHPRSLVVYSVVAAAAGSGGMGGAALPSYFELARAYEHPLERPAYNLVAGPFGGTAYGRESICVQSMDGVLTVFEQERMALQRQLSKFLLPGPLAYCSKVDGFITYNSQMEVECYRYAVVAGAGGSAPGGSKDARKLHAEWSFVVGEEVIAIEIARFMRSLGPQQARMHACHVTSSSSARSRRARLARPPSSPCVTPLPAPSPPPTCPPTHARTPPPPRRRRWTSSSCRPTCCSASRRTAPSVR